MCNLFRKWTSWRTHIADSKVTMGSGLPGTVLIYALENNNKKDRKIWSKTMYWDQWNDAYRLIVKEYLRENVFKAEYKLICR